jgi:hypothetical protein
MMDDTERHQVLREWSGAGRAAPSCRPVHEVFRRCAERSPRRLAGVGLDLALVVFDGLHRAESVYADVRERAGDAPWMHDLAFVEHHPRNRVVVHGTFAGRFLDIEDEGDPLGPDAAKGALTGAIVGAVSGRRASPLGWWPEAAAWWRAAPTHPSCTGLLRRGARRRPEGSSALVLLASAEHVGAMIDALAGSGGRVVRRTLSDDAVGQLADSVAFAPPASDPPRRVEVD